MRTRPPKTKRTDTLLPDTTLLRSSFAARPNSPLGSGALLRLARIRAEILLELALHVPVLVGMRRLRPLAGYVRSEEHTSELQSLMRTSYAVFCLKKKKQLPLYSPIVIITNTTHRTLHKHKPH